VYGDVTGISIATDGTVSATFSNGLTKAVYKVPLATFANPDGLEAVSGNAYIATNDSGNAVINAPEAGGAGKINSSQLEDSNVDLATELTDLITTQRAYSACAKIVTTSSTMLDDLLNTVR
jgi:flagellar hook protein FlgE